MKFKKPKQPKKGKGSKCQKTGKEKISGPAIGKVKSRMVKIKKSKIITKKKLQSIRIQPKRKGSKLGEKGVKGEEQKKVLFKINGKGDRSENGQKTSRAQSRASGKEGKEGKEGKKRCSGVIDDGVGIGGIEEEEKKMGVGIRCKEMRIDDMSDSLDEDSDGQVVISSNLRFLMNPMLTMETYSSTENSGDDPSLVLTHRTHKPITTQNTSKNPKSNLQK